MTLLLAFTGGLGSGKSEALSIIQNIKGKRNVHSLKFAQPLYELQDLIQQHLQLPKKKDRTLLQLLGTDWGRSIDPDIWVNQFVKTSQIMRDFYEIVVCDDMRFSNEFRAVKAEGFKTVRIHRPLHHRIGFVGTGDINHISETGLSHVLDEEFDYVINNNGTYDDFVTKISDMLITFNQF